MKKTFIIAAAIAVFIVCGIGPQLAAQPAERAEIPPAGFTFDPAVKPLGQAHRKYLVDKVEFTAIPMQSGGAAKTAVVGSKVAKFYPNAVLKSSADLGKLRQGEPLPIGTFLVIKKEIVDHKTKDDPEMRGLFKFEGEYNYFYEITFQGRNGLVFGADLAGLGRSAKENSVTSFYYTRPQKSPAFYDHNGQKAVDARLQSALTADRIAFEAVGKNEFYLWPDDMVALYAQECRDRERSLFLTTDLFAHTLHLLFDRMLAASEEERFLPALLELTDGFLRELEALKKADKGNRPGYTEAVALARTYFQVPQALLRLAPRKSATREWEEEKYETPDRRKIMPQYGPAVQAEIRLIEAAQGFAVSPNFGYKEDYSQFKPRGHYTKNGALSAYFRAMIWFGRVHFYMSLAKAPVLDKNYKPTKEEGTARNAGDASLRLTPAALVISQIAKKNAGLLGRWKACFDPITYLIGQSDDLSLYDVMPALDAYAFGDFPAWADDPKKIIDFLSWGANRFPRPRIAGNSVFFAPAVGWLEPAAGFRLFGQRFTDDSYIHMQVSPPRLMSRNWVSGLDIMKVFGSQTAEQLLAKACYPSQTGLKDGLARLQKEHEGYGADFWGKTYYDRTLYLVKSQAQFEPGQGFFFTETPMWGVKAMLSSHGAWAELRHDTILYVKQSYAEMGAGEQEPTFRTVPVPRPVHYVEPNLYFFRNAYLLVADLAKSLQGNGMFAVGYPSKLQEYATILRNVLPVVEAEIADRPISEEQNEYLTTIPGKLGEIILPVGSGAWSYTEDKSQLQMALVADVYTNAELGQVLETAVGIPYRLYAALNDGQGGKRIAVGYTFSYYEFQQPMSDRLNDDQWKAIVYADKPDMDRYLPFWAKNITVGK